MWSRLGNSQGICAMRYLVGLGLVDLYFKSPGIQGKSQFWMGYQALARSRSYEEFLLCVGLVLEDS